jgi:hypothetical protein
MTRNRLDAQLSLLFGLTLLSTSLIYTTCIALPFYLGRDSIDNVSANSSVVEVSVDSVLPNGWKAPPIVYELVFFASFCFHYLNLPLLIYFLFMMTNLYRRNLTLLEKRLWLSAIIIYVPTLLFTWADRFDILRWFTD